MIGRCSTCADRGKPVALLWGLVLLAAGNFALAGDQPTEQQILEALKARGPARGAHDSAIDRDRSADERRLIEALLKKKPRTITIEDRRQVAHIVSHKPSIDLEVTFEFNSAVIGPQAVPTLVTLGRALANAELAGATFVVAGHTDAAGNDNYNQLLSERRAEAVKSFLTEHFKLSPDQLLAIGFGKTQLKNTVDPFAGENRRVQIVNTELK